MPGDLDETVNTTKKTIMEKDQIEFVIGICILLVLVVISVSIIVKLRKTKRVKEDEHQTTSIYVTYNMRSSLSYESLFVNRRNNNDAYENRYTRKSF